MFNSQLYADEISIFGEHIVLEDWQQDLPRHWTTIARYEKEDHSDGQPVEIDVACLPAHFYRLRALPSVNSVNDPVRPFTITTGTGVAQFVHDMATLVAQGMIGVPEVGDES